MEQAVETAAPIEDIATVESVELAPTGGKQIRRRMTKEEKEELLADLGEQQKNMQIMAGMMLQRFKSAIENKELDFEQEIKLFREIKPFLGYNASGSKIAADIGMDSFALKYIELSSHINSVGKQSSK